ncbi:hypothetical protein MADP15_00398 [Mycoplasma anatis]|uniref:hypothetical protein n=1 Tax=Mycoplasmopsis anatis TaxID=171279 RepID=UPI001C4E0AEB|nr:hypothetical protein [Mycoplasmopsis anatis]MBW0596103.1 hypothetical protein [Mycoplasmopsis anatis]MBW0597541.1 hypothetical protein [Mycoplasmopsis anatis]MBW0600461.1 hypothetical protein [Mycoplasmopsis anatis]
MSIKISKSKIINNIEFNPKIMNQINEVNSKFKSKNFLNSDYFELMEIASNVNNKKISQIINCLNEIIENKTQTLVVYSNNRVEHNINLIKNYLYSNSKKWFNSTIEIVFLNSDDNAEKYNKNLEFILNKVSKFSFIIIRNEFNLYENTSRFKDFIKLFTNKLGFEYFGNNSYLFLPSNSTKFINEFSLNSRFISLISSKISRNLFYFTDYMLLLYAFTGVNIYEFIKGYKTCFALSNEDFENNLPLEIASQLYFNLTRKNEFNLIFLAYNSPSLKLLINDLTQNLNYIDSSNFYDRFELPHNIYQNYQMFLEYNKNKSVLFFNLLNEKIDYQISPEVDNDYLSQNIIINSLEQLNNDVSNLFIDSLSFNNSYTQSLIVEIYNNDHYHLGYILSLNSLILVYLSIFNNVSAFKK